MNMEGAATPTFDQFKRRIPKNQIQTKPAKKDRLQKTLSSALDTFENCIAAS
ncbi:MAG: hypothetical protein N838_10395 [Thiohalocapsa sp. PB-PSB1]|jgi:hypothetical protein|nr:MAG: hypothetical protein N838_10395 [Thiohalocapsa sp. PB-PSB1]